MSVSDQDPIRARRLRAAGLLAAIAGAWAAYQGVTGANVMLYLLAAALTSFAAVTWRPLVGASFGALVVSAAVLAGLVRVGTLAFGVSEWLSVATWIIGGALAGALSAWCWRRSRRLGALAAIPIAFALSLCIASPRNGLDSVVTRSTYVAMDDGVRLAVDYVLPRGVEASARFPSVVVFTRYYRRTAMRFPFNVFLAQGSGNQRRLAKAGYASVFVDVRGSGASFGTREREMSIREVDDYLRIVDWVITQPWSNGVVGAEGVSYSGTAAEMLMLRGHPAVKAVVLQYSLFDAYTDAAFPGGLENLRLSKAWSTMLRAIDSGRPPPGSGWLIETAWLGPEPVDDDRDGTQLRAALAEHANNYDIERMRAGLEFRDDAPTGVRFFDNYPYASIETANSEPVPTLVVTGWLDGGYQGAAFKRWINTAHPDQYVVIGPWDHGPFNVIDPCGQRHDARAGRRSDWTLPFYDRYLKGEVAAFAEVPQIRYYTMCGGGWRAANAWPPSREVRTLYLGPGGALADQPPAADNTVAYRVDRSTTSGGGSRWAALYQNLAAPHVSGYGNRAAASSRLLTFTGEPLATDLDISGHASVRLHLASSEPDGALIAYVEEVAPDGSVRYITEGVLRLAHRAVMAAPHYRDYGPVRSHTRADGRPMLPGQFETIELGLLPVSYRVPKGHRLRVAIAGADEGNLRTLEGVPPIYTLRLGGDDPAQLALPIGPGASRSWERPE